MSCLGVLFSIDQAEVDRLKSIDSDPGRLEYLQENIEEIYFDKYPQYVAELDKSWDAIHRTLTDGQLQYKNGSFPLNHVILGGEILYTSGDYIMTLKAQQEVREISNALKNLEKSSVRDRYFNINETDYGFSLTEDDFNYTWQWLEGTLNFWEQSAKENRYVLFTVDQ